MIVISPLSRLPELLAAEQVSHALSLLAPGSEFPALPLAPERHLKLAFHDITQEREGHIAPARAHMEQILDFASRWQREGAMLIHCWAGISRSTASAYAAMCLLHPDRSEAELAGELRAASPEATPNLRLVTLADEILGRQGRMVAAISALGRGAEAFEGSVVRWPIRLP